MTYHATSHVFRNISPTHTTELLFKLLCVTDGLVKSNKFSVESLWVFIPAAI